MRETTAAERAGRGREGEGGGEREKGGGRRKTNIMRGRKGGWGDAAKHTVAGWLNREPRIDQPLDLAAVLVQRDRAPDGGLAVVEIPRRQAHDGLGRRDEDLDVGRVAESCRAGVGGRGRT